METDPVLKEARIEMTSFLKANGLRIEGDETISELAEAIANVEETNSRKQAA